MHTSAKESRLRKSQRISSPPSLVAISRHLLAGGGWLIRNTTENVGPLAVSTYTSLLLEQQHMLCWHARPLADGLRGYSTDAGNGGGSAQVLAKSLIHGGRA